MANDSSDPKQAPQNTAAEETSQISKFLQIEVPHPLTREAIVDAVDKALRDQRIIPTFHTSPTANPLPGVSAAASEYAGDDPDQGKGLLMFVRSQGPGH